MNPTPHSTATNATYTTNSTSTVPFVVSSFHQLQLPPCSALVECVLFANISVQILDSTEKAVEHSLASTGHVNTRAMDIYSNSFKTTCFTWIMIFVMTCIFIMVVLLIRVT
ncbi:hypothetical protein CK203_103988 [Vitis vinifera]|uniref:Uncharacterized protein n=1 Tax=Vitis vinifera TaxID=29760 RepID=A0A438CZ64_VITVI|nr:hypothetical protein CK203_103988 [Vitis vinifera]